MKINKGDLLAKDDNIIHADPQKGLFIDMLTKDIPILKAISDLVDNCVDGAKRQKPNGDFAGLWVAINISNNTFDIKDNCGGISAKIARDYAFKFGRPNDAQKTKGSIGQFGVGMKRAIFRLGKLARIESLTKEDHFLININVEEWKKIEKWEFVMEPVAKGQNRIKEPGTAISITALQEVVKENFQDPKFEKRLFDELLTAHQIQINAGLRIAVNGKSLHTHPMELLESGEIKPAYKKIEIGKKGSDNYLFAEIYTGVGESDPTNAGWYVFCNGRLLLNADKSVTTGWGDDLILVSEKVKIPKAHNQFARFRGYVFFESDNAALLPWNTTKSGVDPDSLVYQGIRQQMILLMRPVIDFLNRLDQETDPEGIGAKPLTAELKKSKPIKVTAITKREATFKAPKPSAAKSGPKEAHILYSKPEARVEKVKNALKVSTNREVGEKTFEYFYKMEIDGE